MTTRIAIELATLPIVAPTRPTAFAASADPVVSDQDPLAEAGHRQECGARSRNDEAAMKPDAKGCSQSVTQRYRCDCEASVSPRATCGTPHAPRRPHAAVATE